MSNRTAFAEKSEISGAVRCNGRGEIRFRNRDGQTRLADLYHSDPVRFLMPRPARGDVLTAVQITTSGGLTGGDRLDLSVHLEPEAQALVMGQAAEKIYRSTGDDTEINIRLELARGSWLEWLPQETILHNHARLRRNTVIDLQPGARLLAAEMLVFGRKAHGERLTDGAIRENWTVRLEGKPVWMDRLCLDGEDALGSAPGGALQEILAHPACFDGAEACATLVWYGGGADAATEQGWPGAVQSLEIARSLLPEEGAVPGLRCAVTEIGGLLVLRWIGKNAFALRQAFGSFWAGFRHAMAGLPDRMPPLWRS